jgi:hypothetical protein
MAESAPFFWGGSGERLSPEAIKRRRAVAAAMLKNGMDYSPVQHWTQGLARVAQALVGGYEEGKLDRAEKTNAAEDAKVSSALVSQLLGGATPSAPPSGLRPSTVGGAAVPSPPGGDLSASFNEVGPKLVADLKRDFGLTDVQAASVVGNLAHESAGFGTMQEVKPLVPGSRGGFGYAQWTGPRRVAFEGWARSNGLDPTSYDANYGFLRHELANTGEGKVLADLRAAQDPQTATRIFSDQFLRPGVPGMGSRQQWTQRALAFAPSADIPAPGASPVSQETGQPGFAIPPAPQPSPMTGMQFNAIHANDVIPPVFQSEGIGQPWMGTALPPQPTGPTMVAAPLPPSRPTDLAMPQADLPAPGAVPTIGQLPTGPMEDLSNAPGAGGREQLVQALMQQQGQGAPSGMTATQAAATPVQRVAQAVAASQGAPSATSDSALAAALVSENPALQRVAQAVLTNRVEGSRGVVMGDRLINPRTGAVIADYSQANGGRSSEFGLNPIYGVDKDGNPVVMQLGKRGDAAATKLPEGVKLARDPIKVDGPTGTTLLDPQTRQQIGFIPKDNAKAESDKVVGKAAGEATTGLPTAIAQAEQFLGTINQVRKHPGRFDWGATGASADWPIIGGGLGGTKARDFVGMVDQLKGQAFLDAFDALRGGGAISEAEGKVATQARARLDRAQTKEGFDRALSDLEGVIRRGLETARQKAGVKATPAPSGGVDTSKPGSYRFDPATGKMEPA